MSFHDSTANRAIQFGDAIRSTVAIDCDIQSRVECRFDFHHPAIVFDHHQCLLLSTTTPSSHWFKRSVEYVLYASVYNKFDIIYIRILRWIWNLILIHI